MRFQVRPYATGGDVIVKAGGRPVRGEDDLGTIVASYRAGQEIELELYRDGRRRTVRVKLGERPLTRPRISAP
jgi:serine protease Do